MATLRCSVCLFIGEEAEFPASMSAHNDPRCPKCYSTDVEAYRCRADEADDQSVQSVDSEEV